ncbi:MAG: flagellar basal-body rod protein FlgG [Myxococcales bacterium]|nr:flagellar basal-body rod protein FlgG [Myxococcales bacterium]
MFRSLYVASTGMIAQETRLDAIANNLANANTSGFKRQDAEFEDLMYQQQRTPGRLADGGMGPTGVQIGLGSRVVATPRYFTQGNLEQTGNAFDVAIEGNGFFVVNQPDGTLGYTRAGQFKMDSQGRLTTTSGMPLEPPISIPSDALEITIGNDGKMSVTHSTQAEPTDLGQIQLATFTNPNGLRALGHNLYSATASSGEANTGTPKTDGRGGLMQHAIEGSNVEVVTEMIDMIRVQRAYEINSKIITTADEMLRKATSLR